MRDGDDVPPRMFAVQPLDRRRHPRAQLSETLAARRPLVGRAEPERKARAVAAGEEIGAHLPLPVAQMLLANSATATGSAA